MILTISLTHMPVQRERFNCFAASPRIQPSSPLKRTSSLQGWCISSWRRCPATCGRSERLTAVRSSFRHTASRTALHNTDMIYCTNRNKPCCVHCWTTSDIITLPPASRIEISNHTDSNISFMSCSYLWIEPCRSWIPHRNPRFALLTPPPSRLWRSPSYSSCCLQSCSYILTALYVLS